ncbi:MAG TPA: hypothetical protein K8V47_03480 [Candidatus Amulumruptor caecigallinarius]|uniref:Uncharacterized protein n=1 Tax=Candidatus Amulumruptor caecigallinarius TaxID=2109911 RepID=A0A921E7Z0_9BACT|nr:hypothetical protein [Candidatus Amulumruptor caecigallinarius]
MRGDSYSRPSYALRLLASPIVAERATPEAHAFIYANRDRKPHTAPIGAAQGVRRIYIAMDIYRCFILDSDEILREFQSVKNQASINAFQ